MIGLEGENILKGLIVPLWNWKLIAFFCSSMSEGLNCTFMELKDKLDKSSYVVDAGLNCTFMELKAVWNFPYSGTFKGLIVPLWNWKTVDDDVLLELSKA